MLASSPNSISSYPHHYILVSRALLIRGNFFAETFALAPKKITKFQVEMTTSIEDLKASMEAMTKQFVGF
jgi:hypothetical protein